jgi:hypothetical protein
MVAGAKPFNAVDDGAIMAVSSLTGWQHLHQHVWRDD